MWGKGNTCALLVGELIAVATLEKNPKLPQKIKNKTTYDRQFYFCIFMEKNESTNSKRYMNPYVSCWIIHNNQDMAAI